MIFRYIIRYLTKTPVKYFFITLILLFYFNNPTFSKTQNEIINLKILKYPQKSKLIFQSDINYDKKFIFPTNILYNVAKYTYNPFYTTLGGISNYKIILGNRYLVLKLYYASGGSGSIDNIVIFDLKKPRAWQLSFSETIASDSNYSFSLDEKYMCSFSDKFHTPFVIVGFNKKNENEPYISNVIQRDQLEKFINKKLKSKLEIENITGIWKNNQLQIIIENGFIDKKDSKYQKLRLIYDPNKRKIIDIEIDSQIKKEFVEVKNSENINYDIALYSPKNDFKILEDYSDEKYYLNHLIRVKDNKIIFSYKYLKSEKITYKWLKSDKFLFVDKNSKLHIKQIINNGEVLKDSIIKNIPTIFLKDGFTTDIFSNIDKNHISIVANNNIYLIDFEKLLLSKITNLNHYFKYDKFNSIIESWKRPMVSSPFISVDSRKIFYSMTKRFNGGYDDMKLIEVSY